MCSSDLRNGYGQWVTKYEVQYCDNGVNFKYYMEQGQAAIKVKSFSTRTQTLLTLLTFLHISTISLLKIRRRQTSVTASGSEITARKTSGCRRCEVSRRSGLVCNVKKAILPSRVKRE